MNFTYNKYLDETCLSSIELRPSNWFAFFTEIGTETRFKNVVTGSGLTRSFPYYSGISLTSSGGANFSLAGVSDSPSAKHSDILRMTETFTTKTNRHGKLVQLGWTDCWLHKTEIETLSKIT